MTNPVDHTPPPNPTAPSGPSGDPPVNVIPFPDHQPPPPALPDNDPYLTQIDHQTPAKLDPTAPHNPDAEQAILGALLTEPTTLADVRPLITTATDFYRPIHADLYTLITRLADNGQPIDIITIGDHLLRTGTLNQPLWRQAGGLAYLHQLQQACPITANAPAYAETVRDYARLRRAATVGQQLLQLVRDADTSRVHDTLLAGIDTLDQAFRADGTTETVNTTGLHDLSWILTGEAPLTPPPAYTHRTDGHALFYAGKVNGVFGDPESGKSWLAQTAIVEALNDGGTAAMIDVDHNGADHTSARLILLGARPDHLADQTRFRYYEPEDNEQLLAAVDEITSWHPDVYILDSVGEVLPMMGVKSVDNDEITAALRRTCLPPATAGCCVITIDHLPKNPDSRQSGYAIGGTAKKRMMRGSYLRVEVRTQPAPGQIGRTTIRIEKDTSGELRKVTPGGYVGTFILDSTRPGCTTWSVDRETAPVDHTTGAVRRTKYMEAVSRYVEDNDQCTKREIEAHLKTRGFGTAAFQREAISTLISEGYITSFDGPRRSTLHHSLIHYREAEDDHLNPDA